MTLPEPLAVTLLVAEAFEHLRVPYFIGGSLACAVHGLSRATMDADLVADLKSVQVSRLNRLLSGAFYLDQEAIRTAILIRSSFYLVHLETAFKIDVFIPRDRPYDKTRLSRRSAISLAAIPRRRLYIASAEDAILSKLEWFRAGGESSDRHWLDVISVMKVQGKRLDLDYLRRWAKELGFTDLLEGAFFEADH